MQTTQPRAHTAPPPALDFHIQGHHSPALITQGQMPEN